MGTLGLKPLAYKTHHLKNVKRFHNESAHEAETGIGKEFFDSFSENLFHLNIQPLSLHRGRKKEVRRFFSVFLLSEKQAHPRHPPAQDL